jgi:hypothetical protein
VRVEVLRGRARQTFVATVVEKEGPRVLLPRDFEGLRRFEGPEWRGRIESLGDCATLQSRIKELETRLKDLEKKLQRFLQNQEMARKSRSTADQKDEREQAWKELPGVARANWIMAYYAENSGDFEVMPKPQFSACRECGGTGTRLLTMAGANVSREEVGKGSNEQVIECPTCHGLGVIRRISYR